jgi:hypothetical protein
MGQAKRKGGTREERAQVAVEHGRIKREPNSSRMSRQGLAVQEAFSAIAQLGMQELAQHAMGAGPELERTPSGWIVSKILGITGPRELVAPLEQKALERQAQTQEPAQETSS